MSAQENKELVRRILEEYNAIKGDAAKARAWVDRSYSPESVTHAPISGDMNFEQIKQYHAAQVGALTPHYTVKNVIAEGDVVVSQFTLNATHQGTYMGIPATGKKMQVEGAMVIKVGDNKMQELWLYVDTLGMMRQLGAIPTPPAPAK